MIVKNDAMKMMMGSTLKAKMYPPIGRPVA